MSNRLSASRYHLATLCAYPFRPDVSWPERPAGKAALLGSAVHAHVEAHVKGTKVETDHDLEAWPMARQAIQWLGAQEESTACEIAIIYNAERDTARLVECPAPREYGPVGPLEIPTTLDLVWRNDDDESVTIIDLKTGKREHAHVEQLHIQALAASRLYGIPRADVSFLFARKTKVSVEVPGHEAPYVTLDEAALEAESWRVSSILRRLPMAQPEPGSHCWHCPLGMDRCPAHSREAEALETGT